MDQTGINWTDAAQVNAALARFPAVFSEEIQHALRLAGQLIVSEVRAVAPVGDGYLSNSVNAADPTPTMNGWQVSVGDSANYGEVIENGRRPGARMAPVMALTGKPEGLDLWVWDHRRFFSGVDTEEQVQGVALAIARKQARRGFAPPHQQGWQMYKKAAAPGGAGVRGVEAALRRCQTRIAARCNKGA